MSSPITITPAAAKRIGELIAREQKPDQVLRFRVYILGGGCSGFQYGFGFEDELLEHDQIFPFANFALVVDEISLQYLQGATVNYLSDLMGNRFVVDNPNAKTTCGCGSSFSV